MYSASLTTSKLPVAVLGLLLNRGLVSCGLQGGEHTLARLELLGEELIQFVVHLEQVSSGGLTDDELQLVPLQVPKDEDSGSPAYDKNNY